MNMIVYFGVTKKCVLYRLVEIQGKTEIEHVDAISFSFYIVILYEKASYVTTRPGHLHVMGLLYIFAMMLQSSHQCQCHCQSIVLVLTGNMIFSFVLTRKEMRNSFNHLLVALAFFDSCYIIGAVLETIR